jgi:hypothetical protein
MGGRGGLVFSVGYSALGLFSGPGGGGDDNFHGSRNVDQYFYTIGSDFSIGR